MTGMAGIGGVGGGGLAVGGATAIMAAMPAPASATAAQGSAPACCTAQAAGADSPMMKLAEKLDDIMTAALLLEMMDRKKDESSGIVDALVAATAVSLYREMQSMESAGASAGVAGVTVSVTA